MSKPEEIQEFNGGTPSITTAKVMMSFGSSGIPYDIAAQVDSPEQINAGTVMFGLDGNPVVDRPHKIQLQLSEEEMKQINEIAVQEGKAHQDVVSNLISDFLKSKP